MERGRREKMEGEWGDWMNGVGVIDGEGLMTGRRERSLRWKKGGTSIWRGDWMEGGGVIDGDGCI